MSRIESFPITKETVNEFININKTKWDNSSSGVKREVILINLSMVRMQVAWVIPKLLFAKGIEEKTGATPVAITWSNNELLKSFFASFGIEHISLDDLCNSDKLLGIKAFAKTLGVVLFGKSPERIKSIKVSGCKVGLDIYEDILRTSSLSTLRTCRNKVAIKKTIHILWAIYALMKFGKKNKISYAIVDDLAYHEGAFIKIFKALGAKVIASSNVGYESVKLKEDGCILRRAQGDRLDYIKLVDSVTEDNVLQTEELLIARFAGKSGREIDRGAFAGKKIMSKEEMQDLLGLDKNKKTIVIMAHTFTDAVYNYGLYYFKDYYDWLEKTLEIAETVEDVNWVLKPHPTRSAYNESEDSIEKMFDRHKKANIFWTGDDISGESIKNISDAIVTIGGNAGAEYACFGIPAIIVGEPWYSRFGYTIEPSTYEEYKKVLINAKDIKPLDDNQIKTAKKLFYIRNNDNRSQKGYKDELANLLNSHYSDMIGKMAISYFKENKGTSDYNAETLKAYCEYIKTHDVKESQYYQKGYEQ